MRPVPRRATPPLIKALPILRPTSQPIAAKSAHGPFSMASALRAARRMGQVLTKERTKAACRAGERTSASTYLKFRGGHIRTPHGSGGAGAQRRPNNRVWSATRYCRTPLSAASPVIEKQFKNSGFFSSHFSFSCVFLWEAVFGREGGRRGSRGCARVRRAAKPVHGRPARVCLPRGSASRSGQFFRGEEGARSCRRSDIQIITTMLGIFTKLFFEAIDIARALRLGCAKCKAVPF